MKKIQTQTIITSIRSRRDGSLGFSAETPELTDEEKVEFMRLQNNVLETLFIPKDEPNVPEIKINTDLQNKTQSQRLRGVLFRVWEQKGSLGDFSDYYEKEMDRVINLYKGVLE